MTRQTTRSSFAAVCALVLLAGCFGTRDTYRPPTSARESCEQIVLARSLGARLPVDLFNREVDRCLNEYRGIFHADGPDLSVRTARCARSPGTSDVNISVNAVNTHPGRDLEFWVEIRNGRIVQPGTGTLLGTFPTLRYRVPPGVAFPQNSPVLLPVGTVTVPSFPVDLGFEVVVDADNEYIEANEMDNVRPSGCSNVQ